MTLKMLFLTMNKNIDVDLQFFGVFWCFVFFGHNPGVKL